MHCSTVLLRALQQATYTRLFWATGLLLLCASSPSYSTSCSHHKSSGTAIRLVLKIVFCAYMTDILCVQGVALRSTLGCGRQHSSQCCLHISAIPLHWSLFKKI